MTDHHHHHGLTHDLATLDRQFHERRLALRWLGAGAAIAVVGCGGGGGSSGDTSTTTTTTTTTTTGSDTSSGSSSSSSSSTGTTSCTTVPSETAGPYPGDGTNTGGSGGVANALSLSGVVRSDLTSSFAGATGVAAGIPLTIKLKLVNTASSCASLSGYAIYLWHCDALGRYSMYSSGVVGENYLRGVQVTDSNGEVTFTTIYPACYSGRWPHAHFEVYRTLALATNGANDIKTSQLAFPGEVNTAVFADSRYTGSASNYSHITLASDNVFSDGATLETPTVTGSNAAGYVATLTIGVNG